MTPRQPRPCVIGSARAIPDGMAGHHQSTSRARSKPRRADLDAKKPRPLARDAVCVTLA
jgi:hypothetical protein